MREGDVVLLENLRFHPGETANDPAFCKELASLAEVYVNDAFGAAHRAHASVAGMVSHFKAKGAGLLMIKEIEFLGGLLKAPQRPFVALLGGAKVSDKIAVIENLLSRVDALLLGGAMANTFLAARGGKLGTSMVELESLDVARRLLDRAVARKVDLLLPVDVIVAAGLDDAEGTAVASDAVPDGKMALDIGPKTVAAFRDRIGAAKTVFWNGPMGVFEKAPFAAGTMECAKAVAASGAVSVVGGGDSVSAVNKSGLASRITHISTGGGASLEFMEGKTLPGVAALEA
jgi:phosphoglycerate kinase